MAGADGATRALFSHPALDCVKSRRRKKDEAQETTQTKHYMSMPKCESGEAILHRRWSNQQLFEALNIKIVTKKRIHTTRAR